MFRFLAGQEVSLDFPAPDRWQEKCPFGEGSLFVPGRWACVAVEPLFFSEFHTKDPHGLFALDAGSVRGAESHRSAAEVLHEVADLRESWNKSRIMLCASLRRHVTVSEKCVID